MRSGKVSRRTVLKAAGAMAGAGVAAKLAGYLPAGAPAVTRAATPSGTPLKIGFQVHRTGIGAVYGKGYERTATAAVSLATRWYTEYAWYLRGAAALLAIAGIVLHLRRRNACSLRGAQANLSLIVTTAVVGVLAYGALYWITTWLGTLAR